MAKSKTIVWGPLKIEKTEVTDATVTEADKVKLIAITSFDCFPPPESVTEFVRPSTISAEVLERYLQGGEKADLQAVHTQFGKPLKTIDDILKEIADRLDFNNMPVFYLGAKYKKLRHGSECFKTTLYLRVAYKVYQIKITADQQIKLDKKTFPAGDEVATYRMRQPFRFRFETHHEWNPRCCPKKPDKTPESETTDWYASLHFDADDFKFRPRFKFRLEGPGLKWTPKNEEDDEDDRFKLRIKLKYDF